MSSPATAPAANTSPNSNGFTAAPGSVVHVRDEEWLVTSVEQATDGYFVNVIGLSELVRDTVATFSTALDTIIEADPALTTVVPDSSPGFRKSRLWLEATFRKTPVPFTEPALTTATQALADPLDYQFAAVRQALSPDNLRPRILLADAVGLGKTLEIGMILSELVRRGRGDRILVVTPKHVLEQMQFELWTRFALPFVRLDSTGIQRIRQKLPANRNPFTFYRRVIISIDTLKSDKYVAHLRKQRWDAVVIDESHNVTNTASQNNRLARLLSSRTDALVLASATPHNGRAESFAELIRMLEPSAVRPDGSLVEDEVKRLIIRRHRHSPDVARVVGADWAERLAPRNLLVDASPAENDIAQELEEVWLFPESGHNPYSGSSANLFPWTLAKAFLSSPAALRTTIAERMRRVRPASNAAATGELAALSRLADLAEKAMHEPSAKYQALLDLLDDIGVSATSDRRTVVFAERVATLNWLHDHLVHDLGLADDRVAVLHGGLSDVEQQQIVESFKLASSPIRVLVTGDVASEGVNLHTQCHHLIHFDIPWSLIRIEQRNGRIDRYGQKHRPQITTLLLTPKTERFAGDIRVLTRLVEREHEAHRALGDSASLMGKYDVRAEEDAIRDVIAKRTDLDDVVASTDDVKAASGVAGFLARLQSLGTERAEASDEHSTASTSGKGLAQIYEDDLSFLRDALQEFIRTPGKNPPNGVAWTEHSGQAIASLVPPKDLRQRLEVLPQSYLSARHVAERLTIATSLARGQREIEQARDAESTSLWPEAHYLAPLHPLVEWAADRALAELGRSQMYAVRGRLDEVAVLLLGTLTNARGQLVATTHILSIFPEASNPDFCLSRPAASGSEALAALGLGTVNTGTLVDVAQLQPLVPTAVASAQAIIGDQVTAIEEATAARVARWTQRARSWHQDSLDLTQRQDLRDRRRIVDEETEIAKGMVPDRTLVRPLLLVVPEDFDVSLIGGGF